MEVIDQENGHRIENINFILDIGNGKVKELIGREEYNVQEEWETGEVTFEPLSVIAADPVTCVAYAKQYDLLALEVWRRFNNLAKRDKVLARQSSKVKSNKSGDPITTCLGTYSLETT